MKFWMMLSASVLFIAGCATQTKQPAPVMEQNLTKVTPKPVPQAPKRHIKLKEVQANNYSSSYMYPETNVLKREVVKVASAETTTQGGMSKEECIGMIGQEKFNKYTQMFGDEAASIKRCAMIKAMQ
jgi:PBP1b-binding outer membrane lipoprotein LpoB